MMLYPSLHLAFAFTSVRWLRPILAAVLLTLWDVAMDPAVTTGFVYWHWLTPGEFYGMPLQNWLGWLVVGWILSALFTWVWRDWQVNRSTVPLLLWLVQGGLMAGLAWILHRPLATLFWGIGATVVVAVWLRWRGGASR
jgi:putative membrane protein